LAAHFFLFKKPGERARGRREREKEKTFQSERKGVAAGVRALVCCAVTASKVFPISTPLMMLAEPQSQFLFQQQQPRKSNKKRRVLLYTITTRLSPPIHVIKSFSAYVNI
jgi:hypothetical protein